MEFFNLFLRSFIMRKINRKELVEILRNTKGTTFASLTYKVDESKSKTINKKKVLQKEVTVNVTLNSNYENKVNRILETKQGEHANFVSKEMNGKTLSFPDCKCIVENKKAEKMLYCAIEHNAKRLTTYFHNDVVITKEKAIEKGLFTPAFFKAKDTSGRGVVKKENDFSLITPKIENIKRITLNKEEYFITD
jgi:hypothetical protein